MVEKGTPGMSFGAKEKKVRFFIDCVSHFITPSRIHNQKLTAKFNGISNDISELMNYI